MDQNPLSSSEDQSDQNLSTPISQEDCQIKSREGCYKKKCLKSFFVFSLGGSALTLIFLMITPQSWEPFLISKLKEINTLKEKMFSIEERLHIEQKDQEAHQKDIFGLKEQLKDVLKKIDSLQEKINEIEKSKTLSVSLPTHFLETQWRKVKNLYKKNISFEEELKSIRPYLQSHLLDSLDSLQKMVVKLPKTFEVLQEELNVLKEACKNKASASLWDRVKNIVKGDQHKISLQKFPDSSLILIEDAQSFVINGQLQQAIEKLKNIPSPHQDLFQNWIKESSLRIEMDKLFTELDEKISSSEQSSQSSNP